MSDSWTKYVDVTGTNAKLVAIGRSWLDWTGDPNAWKIPEAAKPEGLSRQKLVDYTRRLRAGIEEFRLAVGAFARLSMNLNLPKLEVEFDGNSDFLGWWEFNVPVPPDPNPPFGYYERNWEEGSGVITFYIRWS